MDQSDIFSTRLMFLYVQVCVRTRIVRSSDLKQSSEHVQMVSTWVTISQTVGWDQASNI